MNPGLVLSFISPKELRGIFKSTNLHPSCLCFPFPLLFLSLLFFLGVLSTPWVPPPCTAVAHNFGHCTIIR